MKTNFVISVLVILILSGNISYTQSLIELEANYISLQNLYSKEKSVLDSLQNKFNSRINEINTEKGKNNPDEEKVTSLMSNSVNLSNHLETQQRKLDKIGKDLEIAKKELNEKYAAVIDSLKIVQKASKGNKEDIENQILYYAAKRIEVIPWITQLSFKPDKILEFKVNEATTGSDKKIFLEYLGNALNEVNTILDKVDAENREINQVIQLQRKASRFVEEAELEGSIASRTSKVESSNPVPDNGIFNTDEKSRAINENLSRNVKVYEDVLNQLNTVKSLSESYDGVQMLGENIDLLSYGRLLKDVKKGLTEYKKMLEQKIGSFR